MEIRPITKEKYEKVLINIATQQHPFNLEELISNSKVDVKLVSFLRINKLVKETPEGECTPAFSAGSCRDVLNNFIEYRSKINDIAYQNKKDLEYFQKNKAWLIDSRNLKDGQIEENVREQIRSELIAEVVQYAELAVKLKKTDITGFITTLLKTK